MPDRPQSTEQEANAQAIYARIKEQFDAEALRLARLLASKEDAHLLEDTEFQVRDRVHDLGAQVLHVALDERKKGGIRAPARTARSAGRRPAASAGGSGPSKR